MGDLRVGIVGVGGIGQCHIDQFRQIEDVQVAAISDPNKTKLDDVGTRYGICARYEKPDELIASDGLDAVVICTPNVFHAQMSIDALKTGKHVLCEKPLALATRDIEQVLETADKCKQIYMGAMCWRFMDPSQTFKKYVDAGKTGELYYARASYMRRRGIPGLGGWFTTRKLAGGGAMFDVGVHVLDLCVWMLGNPKPVGVSAAVYQKFKDRAVAGGWPPANTRVGDKFGSTFDVDDFAAGFVRFENGATLTLETCWSSNNEPVAQIKFYGELAGTTMTSRDLTIYSEDEFGNLVDVQPQVGAANSHLKEDQHFVECVRSGQKPMTKPEEMVNVVRILEAFYKSSERGKEVSLRPGKAK